MTTIAVFLPVMPQSSYKDAIEESLSFLKPQFTLEFVDPLGMTDEVNNFLNYQQWEVWLQQRKDLYSAYLGFSFGGMVLQQCFPYLEKLQKPVILFSTPTFADRDLHAKLSKVIELCREQKLTESLNCLYGHALFPKTLARQRFPIEKESVAQARLIHGLQRVLDTDAQEILAKTQLPYTHFIGEKSALVNTANVHIAKTGDLRVVPRAGMRVLEDNLAFCKPIILERLNGKS
jgi:hypothetical protein